MDRRERSGRYRAEIYHLPRTKRPVGLLAPLRATDKPRRYAEPY